MAIFSSDFLKEHHVVLDLSQFAIFNDSQKIPFEGTEIDSSLNLNDYSDSFNSNSIKTSISENNSFLNNNSTILCNSNASSGENSCNLACNIGSFFYHLVELISQQNIDNLVNYCTVPKKIIIQPGETAYVSLRSKYVASSKHYMCGYIYIST